MLSSHRYDVVFALTGDARRNSRALRQIRALSGRGLRIHVISLDKGGDAGLDISNTTLQLVPPPDVSGPLYFRAVHAVVREAASQIKARIYHASDLYVLPAMSAAATDHGAHLTYDARELYPYVASTTGKPWSRLFWMALERRFIRKADAVFTVSDGIADKLVDLYGIGRPSVVFNVPETGGPILRRSLRAARGATPNESIILHQGQMRPHRGLELLVDAMRDVEHAILVFLGDGPLRPALERQAQEARISSRVRFAERVAPGELLAYTASADLGVTLLEDSCLNHHLALPNKLFEYLTAGVPVVASDLPEIRKVVKGFDVGLVVHPGCREDLVAGLSQASIDKPLRERWRRNIPRALETFNWKAASEHFLRPFESLLQNPL